MSGAGVGNRTAADAAVRPSTHVTTSSWQYHTPLSSTNNHSRRSGKNEVIVIHDDSSEPDIPMSAALYPLPVASSQIYHRQEISNNVAISPSSMAAIVTTKTAATTANNSTAPTLVNSQTSSSRSNMSSSEQQQPRYITRSVIHNEAKRKREEQVAEMLKQQKQEQQPVVTANPYYMMAAVQNNNNHGQPTWTSSALYHAARAVAATAIVPTAAAATIGTTSTTKRPRQQKKATLAAPAPKRRKNNNTTTTTATQKGGGSRRGKQQQKVVEPNCDDRDGHYIVMPGRDFTNRFKINRLLGQGTFGKVMECEDVSSGRLVAIKVIRAVPKYRDAAKIEIRVLQTLQRNDPNNMYRCMHVNETFDYRNHVCMVFDLLGPSVFDFLKDNGFRPFSLHHVQLFAEQLLRSVAFLHSLNLVHTDLKPENILLEDGAYNVVPFGSSQTIKTRMLKSTNIRLIDFGSATFNNEYHSQVVSTRHYRAPEIILNLGWSFPCDMWSIGCIILELLTGEALFQTHDNNEHLAMMEVVVGKAPSHIVHSVAPDLRTKLFRSDGSARYPLPGQPRQSQKGLRAMRPLSQSVNPSTNPIYANLHDLLFRLLQFDPRARITAKEACEHPFFRYRVGPDGRLVNNRPTPTAAVQQPQQQQQQPQRLHRPSFPSSSAAQLSAHVPPSAVQSPTTPSHYAYPQNSAAVAPRMPMRVADYPGNGVNGATTILPSHRHSQYQPQQQSIQTTINPQMLTTPKMAALSITHHHHHPQQQLHYPQQLTAPSYQQYRDYSSSYHHPPYHNSDRRRVSDYAQYQQSQPVQQASVANKRKAGVPIDSGYFPDMVMAAGASGPTSPATTGHGMVNLSSSGVSSVTRPPTVRNYSSGSLFTTASALTGSVASPNYYPPSPVNNSRVSGGGCTLAPLASHALSTQAVSGAGQFNNSVAATSTSSSVGSFQYQQYSRHMAPAASSGNSGQQVAPANHGNATPRLTTATTATPTPGSSSAQLGNHSHNNNGGGVEKNLNTTLATTAVTLPSIGMHKLAGRSLPSLMINQNSRGSNVAESQQSHSHHQQSGGGGGVGGCYQHHLPPAQTLLQQSTATPVTTTAHPVVDYRQSLVSPSSVQQQPHPATPTTGY